MKQLRLAKISTLKDANEYLEKHYWPEWNDSFALPVNDFPDCHRPLGETQDLAAILCHTEDRVIANDYTFSFAGQRYRIDRAQVQAGMRNQRVRVEVRLDGELKARYQRNYLTISECGSREPAPVPVARKPPRKDHNAGGKSRWMEGFFDRPTPPLWKLLRDDA